MKETYSIDKAHVHAVRNIDHNPNKQYTLASSGDDGKVKFWDTRNTKAAALEYASHSHWSVASTSHDMTPH